MHNTSDRFIVLIAFALGAGLCACREDRSCEEGNKTYHDGDGWTCADGCNYCECRDGELSHTGAGCLSPPGPNAGKLACGGPGAQHGDTLPCPDADSGICQQCACDDGVITRASCAE